ncbi:NADH-quinone oxidoreductase subunit M [uncultured Desulfobulbus sp.]|uniref:complex I subunit 4 family protein n=1 Tax=uncultured Desulfobulbus sp. TaxID=239745 RepID=UPI0029C7FEA6|nr:NADH-quinone oxidoreductase subunit M [uncultured Desulfobulbus sp.]
MFEHVLSVIIFLPMLAGLLLLATPASKTIARFTGLVISLATLVLSLDLYAGFAATGHLEFVESIAWIPSLGVSYFLGVDGISLFILMSSSVLLPMVYFIFATKEKGYYANLLIVQGAMAGAICAADMILFYIFWEVMLLPVFFMLGLYGGPKKLPATLKITLYTIAGSLLMLAAIVYLGVSYHAQFNEWSFAIDKMAQLNLSGRVAAIAFFGFMIAFAIKIPLFPFHTWLPDAYTEAPTAATFVLSAIMAKIGVYGVIRFVVPVFDLEFARFAILLAYSGVIGMMYCGFAAITQKDFKRMLAFSSASHMGIIALGVFCMNVQALTGSIYQIVAHATSTGVLFLFAGILEERTNTRTIADLGGIAAKAPIFALYFAIAMLASVGLPGTSGFIGEFMIILGAVKFNTVIGVLAGTTLIVGVCYMLWMFQRVFFEKPTHRSENFKDLSLVEGLTFLPVIILIILMGVYPQPFLSKITPSTALQFTQSQPVVAHAAATNAQNFGLTIEQK